MLEILATSGTVHSIVMMGGTIKFNGNTNPHQEANFRHDPAATETILDLATKNNIPLTIVPLDVTEQEGVLFTPDRMQYLKDRLKKSPVGLQVLEQVAGPDSVYGRFYLGRTKLAEKFPYLEEAYLGVPLHDLTAAVVQSDLRGERKLFKYATVNIQPNEIGEIGAARQYMTPHYPVQIAGPLRRFDAYWQHIVKFFKRFK